MRKRFFIKSILIVIIFISSSILRADDNFRPDNSIFKDTMVEMTWQEVKKSAENGSIVLFPVAVVEEHGPHMDLSPDIYGSAIMCRMIKQELEKNGIHAIIAPPYYWGINTSTGKFPGSFSVSNETFKAVLADSSKCLKNWGFTKIFFVNAHGDPAHNQVLDSSINEVRKNLGIDVYNLSSIMFLSAHESEFPESRQGKFMPDVHAGSNETAIMWTFYPEKVRVKEAEKLKPQSSFEPLGYIGDPASFKIDRERELECFKITIKDSASAIENFLKERKK